MADKLSAFEVFPDRELKVGHPIVARLVGRQFDQLLDAGLYDRPYDARFGKAMVKTLSYVATTLGASFGFAERTELSLYAARQRRRRAAPAVAHRRRGVGQAVAAARRGRDLRGAPLRIPVARHCRSTTSAGGRKRPTSCRSIATARTCCRSRAPTPTAVPRILDGLGPDEKVELLRQNALDFGTVPTWQRHGAAVRIAAGRPPTATRRAGSSST